MGGAPAARTYMGWWGSLGSPTQKGVTSYAVSNYAQNPLKGVAHSAVFNVFRRVKNQAFFVVFPAIVIWEWWVQARDYNEYLYTKAGREELERVNV